MRILLVTQYFYPEYFKSTELAEALVSRGYEVDALVGIPNYPEGKYYKGFGIFKKRVQSYNGIKIYRSFQFPRGKDSKIGLVLNYLSYMFCASFWVISLAIFRKRYDKVFVFQNSPITQALPAIIYKKLRGSPFFLWVQDLWPDVLEFGVGIKNKAVLSCMDRFVRLVYDNSEKILISSKGFKELIQRKGNYADKIEYFPNWSEDILLMPKKDVPTLPEGFKIMMAGNLGKAQMICQVMEAILLLKEKKEVKWIFVGDGSERSYIENFRKEHGLQDTVYLMGRYPFEYMPAFYAQADSMIITMRAKFEHNKAVVPSRLQSYLSSGKPVIGMVDGGSAEIIKESDCGLTVGGEDYESLVKLIIEEILPNRKEFKDKGVNGRKYFEDHFAKGLCIDHLERLMFNQY